MSDQCAELSFVRHVPLEQIALLRRQLETWRRAGRELERIRRRELRELDGHRGICGSAAGEAPPPD